MDRTLNPRPNPWLINTEAELDEVLTLPGEKLVSFISSIASPLLVLGAGGKMGPTLAVLAKRAAATAGIPLRVVAVSRFSSPESREWLSQRGVETVSCDLLQRRAVEALPDAQDVIYLAGLKFGTSQNPSATWATNVLIPPIVVERYPRSRVVALSTGNVYPLSSPGRGGSLEEDPLTPVGEYANAAVGRERVFEFCSGLQGTRVTLIRLFYAMELRYGVLVDIARKIHTGEPIDLANGYFNCIWQGDANDMIIRALDLATTPPSAWNLCRSETFAVREIAARLGDELGRPPLFAGREQPSALLGNARKLCGVLGEPATPMDYVLRWVAHWVRQGGRSLAKPTHFEVRDGKY